MAQFHFKLEAILEHRKRLEREKQRALAAVQAQMTLMQNELRQIQQSMQQATDDLRQNHLIGHMDMHYLAAHRRYIFAMQRKGVTLMQRIALVQRDLELAQKELLEAARSRKIIEKLKERQKERWAFDLARSEANELDDIGMKIAFYNLSQQDNR